MILLKMSSRRTSRNIKIVKEVKDKIQENQATKEPKSKCLKLGPKVPN